MSTWQGRKLCRPYRAECFIRGLIPGAAPDGLPQAIKLSCAFSADLVSRAPRWDGGRPRLPNAHMARHGNCAAPTGRNVLLEALYLGRRLTAYPRLLNYPAPSAQISCPGRLAGNAGRPRPPDARATS